MDTATANALPGYLLWIALLLHVAASVWVGNIAFHRRQSFGQFFLASLAFTPIVGLLGLIARPFVPVESERGLADADADPDES